MEVTTTVQDVLMDDSHVSVAGAVELPAPTVSLGGSGGSRRAIVQAAQTAYPLPKGITLEHRVRRPDGSVDDECDFQVIYHNLAVYNLQHLKELSKHLNMPSSKNKTPLCNALVELSNGGQDSWKAKYGRPKLNSHKGPAKAKPSRPLKSHQRLEEMELPTQPGLRPDHRIVADLDTMENAVAYGVALAMTDPYSDDELDSPRPDSGVIDHYLETRSTGTSESIPNTPRVPSTPCPSMASSEVCLTASISRKLDDIMATIQNGGLQISDSGLSHIRDTIVTVTKSSVATAASSSPPGSLAVDSAQIRRSPASYAQILRTPSHGSTRSLSASVYSRRSSTSWDAACTSSRASPSVRSASSGEGPDSSSSLRSSTSSNSASGKWKLERSITLRGTVHKIIVPHKIPAMYFSDDIDGLDKCWGPEDRFEGFGARRNLCLLNNLEVPLNRWREVFIGHPGYGKLKKKLDEYGLVVEEYRRFATYDEFWAAHGGYTGALLAARKRRAAEVTALSERVIASQGTTLGATGSHNIAKRYLKLAKAGKLPRALDHQLWEDITEFYKRDV